jgi:hypothetical protein
VSAEPTNPQMPVTSILMGLKPESRKTSRRFHRNHSLEEEGPKPQSTSFLIRTNS